MSSDLATLKLKVDVQGRLIKTLSRRRAEQAATAAHLLAHQQARGIEAREAWRREILAAGAYVSTWGVGLIDGLVNGTRSIAEQNKRLRRALVDQGPWADQLREERDEARAENERKDAEIERLQAALERVREICDEALPYSGLTIADTTAVRAIAALGEEVPDDAR